MFCWTTLSSLMPPRLLSNKCKLGSLLQLLVLLTSLLLRKVLNDFMLHEVSHYLFLLKTFDKFYFSLYRTKKKNSISHVCDDMLKCFFDFDIGNHMGMDLFYCEILPFDAIQFCIYEHIRIGYMLVVIFSSSIFM